MDSPHVVGSVIVDRYRIIKILGQGGTGITYEALDLKTNQSVALKALSLRHLQDWKQIELFEREAKVLEQLNHPAIPRYLDYFQVDTPENREFYLVRELAEGTSLAALVSMGWRTNEAGVRQIAQQVLEALTYLHGLTPPVIHRDIKPDNLIRGLDGKIYLVDFGAVKATYQSTLARGSTAVGTYGYMAPEQFRGQAVPATDLYGLGTTLLFLLTHRHPADWPQERLKINFRGRIQVSDRLADWLEKMVEPDADDRYPSATEAMTALKGGIKLGPPQFSVSRSVLAGILVSAAVIGGLVYQYQYPLMRWVGIEFNDLCGPVEAGNIRATIATLNYLATTNGRVEDFLKCTTTPEKVAQVVKQVLDRQEISQEEKTLLLLLASDIGSEKAVKLLIAKGANVNSKVQTFTPLLVAINADRYSVVQALIEGGADINRKNNLGQTPLFQAILGSHLDIAKLLISKGANINVLSHGKRTPLHHAAQLGQFEIGKLLIEKGARINVFDNSRNTPLHLLLLGDSTPQSNRLMDKKRFLLAKLLINSGLDCNSINAQGNSPLGVILTEKLRHFDLNWSDSDAFLIPHHQSKNDLVLNQFELEIIELLIIHGAKSINTPNQWGVKNFPIAYQLSRIMLLKSQEKMLVKFQKLLVLMIEKGADLNLRRAIFVYRVKHPNSAMFAVGTWQERDGKDDFFYPTYQAGFCQNHQSSKFFPPEPLLCKAYLKRKQSVLK